MVTNDGPEMVSSGKTEVGVSRRVPQLQGAGTKKVNLSETSSAPGWPSLAEAKTLCSLQGRSIKGFKPVPKKDNQRFPWAARQK